MPFGSDDVIQWVSCFYPTQLNQRKTNVFVAFKTHSDSASTTPCCTQLSTDSTSLDNVGKAHLRQLSHCCKSILSSVLPFLSKLYSTSLLARAAIKGYGGVSSICHSANKDSRPPMVIRRYSLTICLRNNQRCLALRAFLSRFRAANCAQSTSRKTELHWDTVATSSASPCAHIASQGSSRTWAAMVVVYACKPSTATFNRCAHLTATEACRILCLPSCYNIMASR